MNIEYNRWYDYLPHEIRRLYYRKFVPEKYWNLLDFRKLGSETKYSLNGYEKNQCIFIHIPKCAGISVSESLFHNFGGGHLSIMDYKIIYGHKKFKHFFKFTFVRNPWDRVYSAYTFLKKGGLNEQDRQWAEENIKQFNSFDQFVCEWITEKNINTWTHFIPQYKFICDAYGKIQVDFIGRFENISHDFELISNKLNIDVKLPHKNKSNEPKCHYSHYYTKESKDIIRSTYKKDIKLFNYKFE